MSDIKNIEDYLFHDTGKVLCLNMIQVPIIDPLNNEPRFYSKPCFHQWIAVFPEKTDDKKLECPKCGGMNTFTVRLYDE